jgi:hypothetical protein
MRNFQSKMLKRRGQPKNSNSSVNIMLQRILKECEYLDKLENLFDMNLLSKSFHREDKSIKTNSDNSRRGRTIEIFIITFLFTPLTYHHCHLTSTPTFTKKSIINPKGN